MPKLKKYFTAHVPWDLVISAFINKSGELALSLLPMLLIERSVSTSASSLILGLTKVAQVCGLFFGGVLSDRFGFRAIILLSYFLGFLSFTALPFLKSNFLIGLFSAAAQFGSSLFNPSSRALIRERGGLALKKSLAWLRTASNLGQVISGLLGILFGALGLIVPFLIDGMTSFVAFIFGMISLKKTKSSSEKLLPGAVQKGFYIYSWALSAFAFTYELGFLSFSGFGKLALGDEGIRAFAIVLIINALLCGVLAVPASTKFNNPRHALIIGLAFVAGGLVALALLPKTIFYFSVCSLIMTVGEIIFTIHWQALLLINSSGKSSRQYSYSLVIQSCGRMAAGLALFPLVLRSSHPELPFIVGPLLFLVILYFVPREFLNRSEVAIA